MSLKSAVLKIVEKMREHAHQRMTSSQESSSFLSYAFMLEQVCEAAEDPPTQLDPWRTVGPGLAVPDHRTMIERAKEEFRKKIPTESEEDTHRMIPIRGGLSDGDNAPLVGDFPPDGAHTHFAGQIYTYNKSQNAWVYDKEMNKK